jgi:Aminoglycoside-2''-adenylyltransferase
LTVCSGSWRVERKARANSVVALLVWRLTAVMLDATDVLVILDQLYGAGLVVWLDGGWEIDALLGRQSRPSPGLPAGRHRPA